MEFERKFMIEHLLLLILIAISISFITNYLLIQWGHHLALVDEPNHRSSHTFPTARGGGLGILMGFLAAGIVLLLLTSMTYPYAVLLVLSAIIGGLGLYDDFGHCPAIIRLIFHFLVIGIFLITIYHSVTPFLNPILYYLSFIFALFAGVWLINLYNFMDGIDGLAAIETIFVACAAILSLMLTHQNSAITPLLFILAASTIGFLFWNKPPARIFMGDVGSGFLGFIFAGLIIYSVYFHQIHLTSWLLWLSIFWVDSTYTLLVRLVTKQRFFAAHRSHAYQILARQFNSHKKVTLLILAYNLLWLLPLSLIGLYHPYFAWNIALLLAATLPPIIICWKVKAGLKND